MGHQFIQVFKAKMVGKGGYLDDILLLCSYIQCAFLDPMEVAHMDKVKGWLNALAGEGCLPDASAQCNTAQGRLRQNARLPLGDYLVKLAQEEVREVLKFHPRNWLISLI